MMALIWFILLLVRSAPHTMAKTTTYHKES
jgi:hypothetical protein